MLSCELGFGLLLRDEMGLAPLTRVWRQPNYTRDAATWRAGATGPQTERQVVVSWWYVHVFGGDGTVFERERHNRPMPSCAMHSPASHAHVKQRP